MARDTTRIQNLTRVSALADGDVIPMGPASGDVAKGITFSNLQDQIETNDKDTIVETGVTYSTTVADDVVIGTGVITFNLHALSTAIKRITLTSLTATITIDPNGSELINGTSTELLNSGQSITIAPTLAGWITV